jgi:hypothetical protein
MLLFVSSTAKLMVNGYPESAQGQLAMARQLPIPPGTAVAVVAAGNYILPGTLCAAQNYPQHYVVRRGRILALD